MAQVIQNHAEVADITSSHVSEAHHIDAQPDQHDSAEYVDSNAQKLIAETVAEQEVNSPVQPSTEEEQRQSAASHHTQHTKSSRSSARVNAIEVREELNVLHSKVDRILGKYKPAASATYRSTGLYNSYLSTGVEHLLRQSAVITTHYARPSHDAFRNVLTKVDAVLAVSRRNSPERQSVVRHEIYSANPYAKPTDNLTKSASTAVFHTLEAHRAMEARESLRKSIIKVDTALVKSRQLSPERKSVRFVEEYTTVRREPYSAPVNTFKPGYDENKLNNILRNMGSHSATFTPLVHHHDLAVRVSQAPQEIQYRASQRVEAPRKTVAVKENANACGAFENDEDSIIIETIEANVNRITNNVDSYNYFFTGGIDHEEEKPTHRMTKRQEIIAQRKAQEQQLTTEERRERRLAQQSQQEEREESPRKEKTQSPKKRQPVTNNVEFVKKGPYEQQARQNSAQKAEQFITQDQGEIEDFDFSRN